MCSTGAAINPFENDSVMKPLLALVDFQNDYLDGSAIEPAVDAVVELAAQLLTTCRERDIPIVHIRTAVSRDLDNCMKHWKDTNRWKCELGTLGYEPPELLVEQPGEWIIHKTGFSGFAGTDLAALVQQHALDTLIVAGVHLHACVRATVIDAYQLGMKVYIAEDAVASDDPLHAATTRRYLEARTVGFAAVDVLRSTLSGSEISPNSPLEVTTVRAAIDPAASYRSEWRATTKQHRIDLAQRFIEGLAHGAGTLADLIADEVGKPVRFSRTEVIRTGEMLAAIVARFAAYREMEEASSVRVRRRPHGTVAVITPFNNPVFLPLGKILPAILHGNTVVWKPAPEATRVSRQVMTLFRMAGWPEGLVSLLEGDRCVGGALLQDSRIDAVTITGSSAAGFSAQEACGHRRIPLQAELGGNNAAIIWADADLAHAAQQVASGAFDMAGQRCTANRRVVVHRSIYENFMRHLLTASRAIPSGDPTCDETRIGPLVSAARRRFVAGMVRRAEAAGATSIHPMGKESPLSGSVSERWYPPTILRCDEPQHEIVQEETFGPVLVLQTARDWTHAIELCNGVRQGLAAAIFTESGDIADRFLDQAQAGILKVNLSTADAAVDAPFGGWKGSGIGPPEHGVFDIEFFTRCQTVYQNQEAPEK
jgi:acyl-CoA reductase-like NAD-dependent aldehyde dehydrogenase